MESLEKFGLENVSRISIPTIFKYDLNCFIFTGEKTAVLDTSMDIKARIINKFLKKKGIRQKLIEKKQELTVINSHSHVEHFQGNIGLRKRIPGVKVLAGSLEAHTIEDYIERSKTRYDDMWPCLLERYKIAYSQVRNSKVDRILNEGDEIILDGMELKVILTPGHSPGLLSFFDKKYSVLFSTDHIIGDGETYLGLNPTEPIGDGSRSSYIQSLKKIEKLGPKIILPSHGPIIEDGKDKISRLFERHSAVERRTLEILSGKTETLTEITEKFYDMKVDKGFYAHFYREGFVWGILEKLVTERSVLKEEDLYSLT